MIKHIGLFTKSEDDLNKLADRVVAFNIKEGNILINLEAIWSTDSCEGCDEPHYNIQLEYPTKDVALAFWGDKTA